MNPRISIASSRLIPILSLLILGTPLSYIGDIFHEEGHGLLALAQGGTFTGIVIGQNGSYALANSYLVSIGGWLGQYVLAFLVLLLSAKFHPKSFLARSVTAVTVSQNLINQPAYIMSLQGDSARTLQVLEAAGIGHPVSVAILVSAAVLLLLVGGYVSWRIFRNYFFGIFRWMGSRRSSEVSAMFVAVISTASLFAYTSIGESLETNNFTQILLGLAFLLVLALVAIPRAPSSWPETQYSGPSLATFVFELLIFLEAQLVYYFVLPVTIPFP